MSTMIEAASSVLTPPCPGVEIRYGLVVIAIARKLKLKLPIDSDK
jgi:hypothetical protein